MELSRWLKHYLSTPLLHCRPGYWRVSGPNAPAVYKKTSAQGSATVRDLSAGTGLSDNQVRYALQSLLKEGLIVMNGRQGVRSTTYETV